MIAARPARLRRLAFASALLTGVGPAAAALSWDVPGGGQFDLYGQINAGTLYFDDGEEAQGFFPVSNKVSETRLGAGYDARHDGIDFMARFEFQYLVNPTNEVTFDDPFPEARLRPEDIRHAEIGFGDKESWGFIWLGQGDTATKDIPKIDLSGTSVVSTSAIGDVGGAFAFREESGDLSGITIGQAFRNLDSSRIVRVMYETPAFHGAQLRASYGENLWREGDDFAYYNLGLWYAQPDAGSDFDIRAGLGYDWRLAGHGDESDHEAIVGSGSVLHKPTGLNVTLAAGQERLGGDGHYLFAKLGLKRSYFSFGDTALSVDFTRHDDFAAENSDAESWAIAAVQTVDRIDLDVYILYRNYAFDDAQTAFRDSAALLTGIRWRF